MLNMKRGVASQADLKAGIASASFSIAAEAANAIVVSIQLKRWDGADLDYRGAILGYLSDDANGDSVAATAPNGTVAAGTDGVVSQLVSKKVFLFTSEADGDIDLSIGESGTPTFYLVLILPDGHLAVSGAITFA